MNHVETIIPRYGVDYENGKWLAIVDERHTIWKIGVFDTFTEAWRAAEQQRIYDARPITPTTGYALEAR